MSKRLFYFSICNHIIPFLGDIFLPNITKNVLRELQNSIKQQPKTKKNIMDTLSAMLRDACPDFVQKVSQFPGFKGKRCRKL